MPTSLPLTPLVMQEEQLRRASALLMRILLAVPRQKRTDWVVVLDIDDTVVVTDPAAKYGNMAMANKAVPGSLAFYSMVRSMGVNVVFVTARSLHAKHATIAQLVHLGFDSFLDLYMQDWDMYPCAAEWKRMVRNSLVRDGKFILAAVGDQVADVDTETALPFLLWNENLYMCTTAGCPCGLHTRDDVIDAVERLRRIVDHGMVFKPRKAPEGATMFIRN